MKLVNSKIGINIDIPDNPLVLVLENKEIMRNVVNELILQCEGENGDFILSEDNNILKIDKNIELVFNPFSLDFNSKKMLSKLYSDLHIIANDELPIEKNEIVSKIVECIEKISISGPISNIDYEFEKSWTDLFKFVNVKIVDEYESMIDMIINYISIVQRLLNIKIFAFVNIKSFLTDDEMIGLYKYASYNNINLILIEPNQDNQIEGEKYYIIDKDMCIIE